MLNILLTIAKAIGRAIVVAFRALRKQFGRLYRRSQRAAIIVACVCIFLVGGGIWSVADAISHSHIIYDGTTIGVVNVGGMDKDQAIQAVSQEYEQRLHSSGITIYASQEALDAQTSNEESGDTVSVDQENASTSQWTTDADMLQATIDYDGLAEKALQTGHASPFDRIRQLFSPTHLDVPVDLNQSAVDSFCDQIDRTIGDPFENSSVTITDGKATAVEGHDGNMINRQDFASTCSNFFTSDSDTPRQFVAAPTYTPMQIDMAHAQTCSDEVNRALTEDVQFDCNGKQWSFTPSDLGSLTTCDARNDDGQWNLVPSINQDEAKKQIMSEADTSDAENNFTVSFETGDDGSVQVTLSNATEVPDVTEGAATLQSVLYDQPGETGNRFIQINMQSVPTTMSLDEAIDLGVVSQISTYTTEYTARAENRNFNIHRAADAISGSVIKANGGSWSFNDTAGYCGEETGYKPASIVVGNTTEDSYGGGICQVATTVFNAVYESGLPVDERHNHSIYMAGYPAGRDAAVSWPSPDLKWSNDTSSDILLEMSHTDTTVTATLYGIDPGYTVTSDVGNWEPGQAYSTVYEDDDSLPSGTEEVKAQGQDGREITVVRTVRDSDGDIVRADTFDSEYLPQNRVIAQGTA